MPAMATATEPSASVPSASDSSASPASSAAARPAEGARPFERYFNRELSWLEFNGRVLEEAWSESVPLMERVKFLAITTSNLDEFFMVRVAGLKREVQGGVTTPTTDGLTPAEQLRAIALRTRRLLKRQYSCLNGKVRPMLAAEGIRLVTPADLTEADRRHLDRFFDQTLFPVLTPMAVDAGHPFPVLVNNGLYIAASLTASARGLVPGMDVLLVQVPPVLPRFVALPAEKGERRLLPLEEVIRLYLRDLFRGYTIQAAHCFRVTRDSDLVIDDDIDTSLPEAIQAEIRRRRHGAAVRLETEMDMPADMRARLADALHLGREDVYRLPGMLALSGLFELYEIPGTERLRDEPLPALPVRPAPAEGESWFDVIARGDVIMHHPYQTFEPVIELVDAAADDPDVLAIKQTLYRTAKDSRLCRALIRAAENGKQVAVLMELKARFDEERNLDWARRLEQAGAHVVYGVAGLKTHCKALLIIRREADGIRRYVHLATGNYNERTARLYTDLGLFTARPEIGEDVSGLFNVITGYSRPPTWNLIAMAPTDLCKRVTDLIGREILSGSPASPGRIVAKLNSLVDEEVIDALYAASAAGVQVDLIVRGICRLRPGVPGLSDNIRVHSVVDRFLEHSRIVYFRNGGDEEIYLSSADWMQRNFHKRIEVMFPLLDETARRRTWAVLQAGIKDNVKGWRLDPDGRYRRKSEDPAAAGPSGGNGTAGRDKEKDKDREPFRSQLELYREAREFVAERSDREAFRGRRRGGALSPSPRPRGGKPRNRLAGKPKKG
jgi:polyphosphate kinase